jgi:hypothetical protein
LSILQSFHDQSPTAVVWLEHVLVFEAGSMGNSASEPCPCRKQFAAACSTIEAPASQAAARLLLRNVPHAIFSELTLGTRRTLSNPSPPPPNPFSVGPRLFLCQARPAVVCVCNEAGGFKFLKFLNLKKFEMVESAESGRCLCCWLFWVGFNFGWVSFSTSADYPRAFVGATMRPASFVAYCSGGTACYLTEAVGTVLDTKFVCLCSCRAAT